MFTISSLTSSFFPLISQISIIILFWSIQWKYKCIYNWYLKILKKGIFKHLSKLSIHLNPISNIIINPTPWKPAWIFSLVVLDWEDSISFGGSTKTLLSSYKQTNETCIISNHSSPWCLTKFWNWADDTHCHFDAWM